MVTPSPAYLAEMAKQNGTTPRTKVEFIDKSNNVTDITAYYLSGGQFEQVRQRAVAEIQAGQFDILFSNQDDYFSEYKVGSLLYNLDYHGARVRISQGFLLPNGTLEYQAQCTLFIDQLLTDKDISEVTLRCRDALGKIMDRKLHARPDNEIPVANGSNVGDGVIAGFAKLPFAAVNESFTLTCTLAGGDATATFSVVGTHSGSIGPATSGILFTSTAHGIRFTIKAGATNWALGDKFTFTLNQHPEWNKVNVGKIIWAILTGYDWDTNTQLAYSSLVFAFDHSQSDSNVDLDYNVFATMVAVIDSVDVYNLKGFIPYDTDAVTLLQNLIALFLGSIYTGNDGRIRVSTYVPSFTPHFVTFADTAKIMDLYYSRGIDEVINHVSVEYIASDSWPWSDQSLTFDGSFVAEDSTSITNRGLLSQDFVIPWYSDGGDHVEDFAIKLITRYKDPPLNIEFTTGMDALLTEMGDRVQVTDSKSGFSGVIGEVTRIVKQFDAQPSSILVRVRKDGTTNIVTGVLGSEADEGDGISPQSDNYDTSSDSDKQFAYFSKVGSSAPPQYVMF